MENHNSFYFVVLAVMGCCLINAAAQDCKNQADGIYPHPIFCNMYFRCDSGLIAHVSQCSSGYMYDPVSKSCNKPIENPCHTTTVVPVTAVSQGYCRLHGFSNGVHRHPLSCQQYIVCINGYTHVYNCQSGFSFDTNLNACVENNLAAACNNQAATVTPATSDLKSVCERYRLPRGIYPNPDDCEYFVECLDSVTYIMKCPDGLMFNVLSKMCDHRGNVDCDKNYGYSFQ